MIDDQLKIHYFEVAIHGDKKILLKILEPISHLKHKPH